MLEKAYFFCLDLGKCLVPGGICVCWRGEGRISLKNLFKIISLFFPITVSMFISEFVVFVSLSVISDSLQPRELKPIRPLCPWNSPGKNTGVGIAIPFSRGSFWPRIKPGSPALQAHSLLSESAGDRGIIWSSWTLRRGLWCGFISSYFWRDVGLADS